MEKESLILKLIGLQEIIVHITFEWIEFDQFDLIEDTNKRGAFSSIYRWKNQLETWTKELKFLCWGDIVDMLWAISDGLNFIHERDLIHGHWHGGNILVENETDSIDTKLQI
ncbi:hypothetical protein C1646_763192 [Rhizophagus diaphanus]|nr:hypothetical protein C1646_763192 [Rhizophagus diaphanus] [Rhizophagus sp. MUCL 43196]